MSWVPPGNVIASVGVPAGQRALSPRRRGRRSRPPSKSLASVIAWPLLFSIMAIFRSRAPEPPMPVATEKRHAEQAVGAVDLAGEQRVAGGRPRGLLDDLDVEAALGEVAELLRHDDGGAVGQRDEAELDRAGSLRRRCRSHRSPSSTRRTRRRTAASPGSVAPSEARPAALMNDRLSTLATVRTPPVGPVSAPSPSGDGTRKARPHAVCAEFSPTRRGGQPAGAGVRPAGRVYRIWRRNELGALLGRGRRRSAAGCRPRRSRRRP